MVGATRGILIFSGGWGGDSDLLTGCNNASFTGTGDFRKRNQYHNSVLWIHRRQVICKEGGESIISLPPGFRILSKSPKTRTIPKMGPLVTYPRWYEQIQCSTHTGTLFLNQQASHALSIWAQTRQDIRWMKNFPILQYIFLPYSVILGTRKWWGH